MGNAALRSHTKKTTRTATPAATPATTTGERQVASEESTNPKVSNRSPEALSATPAVSKGRGTGSRASATANQETANAATPAAARDSQAADRGPKPDRASPRLRWVGLSDQGQGQGRHHGAADSLDHRHEHQNTPRIRKSAADRGEHEESDPAHEDAPAAEMVAQRPARRDQGRQGQSVGADHPFQARGGEAEFALQGRKGNAHDHDIQHHHDLSRARHREGEPLPGLCTRPHGSTVPRPATTNTTPPGTATVRPASWT